MSESHMGKSNCMSKYYFLGVFFVIWVNWPFNETKVQKPYTWIVDVGNRHITLIDINASSLCICVQWGATAQLDDSCTKLLLGGRSARSFPLPWTHSRECAVHCLQYTPSAMCNSPPCHSHLVSEQSDKLTNTGKLMHVSQYVSMDTIKHGLPSAKTPIESNYRIQSW